MIRVIFVLVAGAIGVTAVTAQPDPIAGTKEAMKSNAKHSKGIGAMAKGEGPFDAGAVNAAFTQWSDSAAQLPKLFPENSMKGDTRALPKIWSDPKGFDERITAFAKASAARPKDLEGLKSAFGAVSKACGDCHEGYRAAAKK